MKLTVIDKAFDLLDSSRKFQIYLEKKQFSLRRVHDILINPLIKETCFILPRVMYVERFFSLPQKLDPGTPNSKEPKKC